MVKRLILTTIIVGVAIMMFASAVMPALAQPNPDRPADPDPGSCQFVFNKLLDAGVPIIKIQKILERMGC